MSLLQLQQVLPQQRRHGLHLVQDVQLPRCDGPGGVILKGRYVTLQPRRRAHTAREGLGGVAQIESHQRFVHHERHVTSTVPGHNPGGDSPVPERRAFGCRSHGVNKEARLSTARGPEQKNHVGNAGRWLRQVVEVLHTAATGEAQGNTVQAIQTKQANQALLAWQLYSKAA